MSLFVKPQNNPAILVIQHSDQAPCGNFCKALIKADAQLTLLKPLSGDTLPSSPGGIDGLVVLGGPQHATDDDEAPHFKRLMELMQEFDKAGKPVAGICLGCQLLARGYGEVPQQLGFLELGFVQHSMTPAAEDDPLFRGEMIPPVMEFHEDTFDLPQGATLLVQGEKCANQCFKIGNLSYGFQFHLEVDEATVESWLQLFQTGQMSHYDNYLKDFRQESFEHMTSKLKYYIRESEIFCDRIAARWLALANKR